MLYQICRKIDGAASGQEVDVFTIESPLFGTFYRAPPLGGGPGDFLHQTADLVSDPNATPYINTNDMIIEGQVFGAVGIMNIPNEIESEVDGLVEEICVENEEAVIFGQPLLRVRLSDRFFIRQLQALVPADG